MQSCAEMTTYDRDQLSRVGEFETLRRRVDIHADKLLALLHVDRDHCL